MMSSAGDARVIAGEKGLAVRSNPHRDRAELHSVVEGQGLLLTVK
jgi:hypothetical protein